MEKTEEAENDEKNDQQQQKGPNFAIIHSRKTLDLRKLSDFNIWNKVFTIYFYICTCP